MSLVNDQGQENYVSADLSAATDRFPIHVIGVVLKGRLPSVWVEA